MSHPYSYSMVEIAGAEIDRLAEHRRFAEQHPDRLVPRRPGILARIRARLPRLRRRRRPRAVAPGARPTPAAR